MAAHALAAGVDSPPSRPPQVLTHVREKFHFVTGDVARLSSELQGVEEDVAGTRASLAASRQHREALRSTNEKAQVSEGAGGRARRRCPRARPPALSASPEQAQQGFAHVDSLAIDFERRKRAVVAQASVRPHACPRT